MSKYISFSLWGNKPKYDVGMLRNAELAKEIYAGWRVRVYHSADTNRDLLENLKKLGCDLVVGDSNLSPYMWRFLIAAVPSERYIIRDADSRLTKREAKMVHDWSKSGKGLHTIHDHPNHQFPMMGGMWGAIGGYISNMPFLIKSYRNNKDYLSDQYFLQQCIWPRAQISHVDHNRETHPLKDGRFVGEVFDENDKPRIESLI